MNTYKNKNVLVTGASGFIGRAICNALSKEGAIIHGFAAEENEDLTRIPNVKFIQGDIRNINSLKDLEFDVAFHLAALPSVWYSNKHPKENFEVNVGGTVNILELAKEKNFRVVMPSSIAVYDGPTQLDQFTEADIQLNSFLALSKYVDELYCEQFNKKFNIPAICLRLGYVYGPGLIRGVMYDILQDTKLFMHLDTVLDFVHIDDVVRAFLLAGLSNIPFGVFNIGSGVGTSVQDLAKKLNKTAKPNNEVEPKRLVMDVQLASQELGWKPTISLDEGLNRIES